MVYNRNSDKYIPVVSALQPGALADAFNDWKKNLDDTKEWDTELTIESSMPLFYYPD